MKAWLVGLNKVAWKQRLECRPHFRLQPQMWSKIVRSLSSFLGRCRTTLSPCRMDELSVERPHRKLNGAEHKSEDIRGRMTNTSNETMYHHQRIMAYELDRSISNRTQGNSLRWHTLPIMVPTSTDDGSSQRSIHDQFNRGHHSNIPSTAMALGKPQPPQIPTAADVSPIRHQLEIVPWS